MPVVNRLAYKDMKIGQTIINKHHNEVMTALRQYSGMTVLDTEKLTPEKEKTLLKINPEIIIVDPLA